MAETLKKWSQRVRKETKGFSEEYMASTHFFRDPIRPLKNNADFIYSPADGILLDLIEVSSTQAHIYTKYHNISLDELSYKQIENGSYWVATIFLTYYDPHIVRLPVSGNLQRLDLPPYLISDAPMLGIEETLLDGKEMLEMNEQIASVAFNQRALFIVKSTIDSLPMHLILTADYDIDTVVSFFNRTHARVKQNMRFGAIRYGSMVTCVVPSCWNVKPVQKVNTHIEAGIDPLFERI
jgi:phosphatidylserine decarboxylase